MDAAAGRAWQQLTRAWNLGRLEFHGLSLRDLEDMTEEGLALLDDWMTWAVAEHNRRLKG